MQRMIDSAIEKRWNEGTETPYAFFRGAQGELNRLDYDDGRSLGHGFLRFLGDFLRSTSLRFTCPVASCRP